MREILTPRDSRNVVVPVARAGREREAQKGGRGGQDPRFLQAPTTRSSGLGAYRTER